MFEYLGRRYKNYSMWKSHGVDLFLNDSVKDRGIFIFITNIYPLFCFLTVIPAFIYSKYNSNKCDLGIIALNFPKYIIENKSLRNDYDNFYLCAYNSTFIFALVFILFGAIGISIIKYKTIKRYPEYYYYSCYNVFILGIIVSVLGPFRIDGLKISENNSIYFLFFMQLFFLYLSSMATFLWVYILKTREGKSKGRN